MPTEAEYAACQHVWEPGDWILPTMPSQTPETCSCCGGSRIVVNMLRRPGARFIASAADVEVLLGDVDLLLKGALNGVDCDQSEFQTKPDQQAEYDAARTSLRAAAIRIKTVLA